MVLSIFTFLMAFCIPALFLTTTGCRGSLWITVGRKGQTWSNQGGFFVFCFFFSPRIKKALFNLHRITVNICKSYFKVLFIQQGQQLQQPNSLFGFDLFPRFFTLSTEWHIVWWKKA